MVYSDLNFMLLGLLLENIMPLLIIYFLAGFIPYKLAKYVIYLRIEQTLLLPATATP